MESQKSTLRQRFGREVKSQKYDASAIESKWQKVWEEQGIYQPDLDKANASTSLSTRNPFYNLMMFPYPTASGMHVGNMYAFTGSDIYGRFKRMQGYDVFEPIGLDGFGIHSENYAIAVGRHPKVQAKISEKNFYKQLRATGNAYDWSRTVETYDSRYYKWTQWIFIQLFKAGLAYRKKAPVNFCPLDKTVLADEQVIDGKCERDGAVVEKRDLEQWFFKITAYANRLLDGLHQIDWTEKVKIAQRQWIGKSEGMEIKFQILPIHTNISIKVYTVFPETIFGVTYMVLAPEHPLVNSLLSRSTSLATSDVAKLREYVEDVRSKGEQERIAEGKEKTGVFTGSYCINPVNGEKIPIWVADYIIGAYGTGAVMGVPGSDHRDFAFAEKYELPIVRVIGKTKDDMSVVDSEVEVLEEGFLVNSERFTGLPTPNPGREKVKVWLEEKGWGKRETTYHLRDWLISRQRYWGPPIPMIFCESCAKNGLSWFTHDNVILNEVKNLSRMRDLRQAERSFARAQDDKKDMAGWFPVPEDQLPVLLPDVKDWKPKGIHSTSSGQAVKSPLASIESFVKTTCPNCGGKAVRETDVSDTFLDSSWYFLRYLAADRDDVPFPSEAFARGPAGSFPRPMSSPAVGGAAGTRRGAPAPVTPGWITDRTQWLPVSMYIGGAEHSVLHLLYTRFITMVLHDLGLVEFKEPFPRFFAHGLLIKEGAKMSKSRGNVVVPDAYIKKYGADTLRTYLMFLGPFSQGGDFYDSSISGVYRFLKRLYLLTTEYLEKQNQQKKYINQQRVKSTAKDKLGHFNKPIDKKLHGTIKKVTEDLENLRYNTAIAALMELLNIYYKYKSDIKYDHLEQFLRMLAPFAPHIAEELWQELKSAEVGSKNFLVPQFSREEPQSVHRVIGARKDANAKNFAASPRQFESIHHNPWPKYDPKLLEEESVTVVVQVDGKVRATLKNQKSKIKNQKYIEEKARESEKVNKHLEGKTVRKVIYVEGKILNFVTG